MEINRNQYFMIGVVFFLIGLQIRMVEKYVLNEDTARYLAERKMADKKDQQPAPVSMFISSDTTAKLASREWRPPEWSGWFFGSIGSVLVLHSLAMRRPG